MNRMASNDQIGRFTSCGLKPAPSLLSSTAIRGLLGAAVATLPALVSWDEARAACVVAVAPNYVCSGANTTTQQVGANNASVTTTPGFSVDTTSSPGVALQIFGNGAISYVDTNASTLTSQGTVGLAVDSTGDDGGTPGSVVVNTAGNIFGTSGGVSVGNAGTGSASVTATGTTSGGGHAIDVRNSATAKDMTVVAGSAVNAGTGVFAQNQGTGFTNITVAGPLTTFSGILAFNYGTDLTVVANGALTPSGSSGNQGRGIQAENRGTGATSVTANASVSNLTYGIIAYNGQGTGFVTPTLSGISGGQGTDLTVNATTVTARDNGIVAVNSGASTGATRVTATGDVTATTTYGLLAVNGDVAFGTTGLVQSTTAGSATSLTVRAASVSGGNSGIVALNTGSGATSVTATGAVAGTAAYGIVAANSAATFNTDGTIANISIAPTGTSLAINAAGVSGGDTGIYAANNGSGATSVSATGTVSGTTGTGIFVDNRVVVADPNSTTLAVNATTVTGGTDGIHAFNAGEGSTNIAVTGAVSGTTGSGIDVYTADKALTISAAAVSGGASGIIARNDGSAATSVTATGLVTGTAGNGIFARTRGAAADPATPSLMVSAAAVRGGVHGIYADNQGQGSTRVIATGAVAGVSGDGIHAFNNTQATSLTVTAAAASGATYGISADNKGTGATSIAASGLVEGGTAAIFATSAGQPITITANGIVRNKSQLSADLAVDASGGSVAFTNAGGMIGTVRFGAGANTFANNAGWNTAGGINEFGGGASQLTNAAGISIFAAANGDVVETTAFNGLADLVNRGSFVMADGGAGDRATTGGNLRFEAGSVYALDINSAGQSDRLTADGAVMLEPGSTLAVNVQGGLLFGSRYTVLTGDGGITGEFGSVTGLPADTAFLTVTDTYDANNAYLDVVKYRNFADAGLTFNQISTGYGLDSLAPGPVVNAIANFNTDAQARAAFDQLSGEAHASAGAVLVDDSRLVRSAAIDRLRSSFGSVGATAMPVMSYAAGGPARVPASTERFALWGQAFGSWGRVHGDGNAASVRRSTGGFIIGGDTLLFDGWRVGLLGGYSNTRFSVPARSSSGSSDNYHISIYGGRQWGNLALRTGAAYTWHDIGASRSVAFAGFNDQLTASYRAQTAQVFGDLGYRIDMNSIAVEPFGGLAYVNLRTEGFREIGGAAALTSARAKTGVTFSTLGFRASTDFALGSMIATARGTLGWRHAFGDTTPMSTFAFAGGSAFAIAGAPIAQNAAVVEAGLDLRLLENATFGVSYNGQFASGARDQSLKANLAVKF